MKNPYSITVWKILFYFFLWHPMNFEAQTNANYVQNGSFEKYSDCNPPRVLRKCQGWCSIDSTVAGALVCHTCTGTVPKNTNTWQFPMTGASYAATTFYNQNSKIGYLRN